MKIVWVSIVVALALLGKSVIEPRFDFVGPFSGGLARVTIGR